MFATQSPCASLNRKVVIHACDTSFKVAGFTNKTIYGDRVEAGWAWFPYKQSFSNFWAPVILPPHLGLCTFSYL